MKYFVVLLVLIVIFGIFMGCDKEKKMDLKENVEKNILFGLTEDQKQLVNIVVSDYSKNSTINDRRIVYDTDNLLWQEKFASFKTMNAVIQKVEDELCRHKYQAIKLELLPDYLGGDVWYFIDINNKEIITVYGEK